MTDAATAFGFTWGPMSVERLATVDRQRGTYRILRVDTGHVQLTVYVSPTGRSVRVFRETQELRVPVIDSETA